MFRGCETQSPGQDVHPTKRGRFRDRFSMRITDGQEVPTALRTPGQVLLTSTAALLVGLLVMAARSEPDPRGFGTWHSALRWPPCTLQLLLNSPCPVCGMVTSWSHFVRGDIAQSLAANAAGTLLATITIISVPWMLICVVTGRRLGYEASKAVAFITAVTFTVVALVQWGLRIWRL